MSVSLDCRLSLYADDSALIFSHRDFDVIGDKLGSELAKCKQWLVDNKLTLHLGKTECLLFGTRRKLKGAEGFRVLCEGTAVGRVFSVKYLGVNLDASLDGSVHANHVMKVCTGRLAFLYRNSAFLDQYCRRLLCTSLIQPYIDYCCSSWYSSLSVSLSKRFDVFQRKMVRFINGYTYRHHVGVTDLVPLSWLNIPDRVSFFKLTHLFRIRHNLAPQYLRVNFSNVSDSHRHFTRGSSSDFHISKDVSLSPRSFAFTAIKQWNALPSSIKCITSLNLFKRKLKDHMFSRYT